MISYKCVSMTNRIIIRGIHYDCSAVDSIYVRMEYLMSTFR